ncbi:MAG: hypothetical protein SF097_02730 [Acidobacteriota bacterium]|nr:hypothetical protein [Acidobacteriota bacterium]
MIEADPTNSRQQFFIAAALSLFVFVAYYFSNPQSGNFYDYTLRIAAVMLDGKLGLEEQPPNWLNEMIPHNGKYYSAFPLGSVLTMMPLAVLQKLHLLNQFPGTFLAALLAAITTWLSFLLTGKYSDNLWRRSLLALFPALATWMWPNLAFAGAWHIALGVAVAAQLAALYFSLVNPKPFWAGLFFAIAFGNRTEILLLAPVFFYLLYKNCCANQETPLGLLGIIDKFAAIPMSLGIATLLYNYARFGSPFDFGYARIPGVLEEPWYLHGIFSIHAIPGNFWAMLLETWNRIPDYPYFVPTGLGGSILLHCPFLIFLFRRGTTDAQLKWLAWGAIALLTLVLWLHGNPGGWQISYRYAMVLLPWMLVIFLESAPKKLTLLEIVLFLLSVAINAYSTWLFLRTNYINPSYQ